ncbi:MAG: DUF2157 domain-containing protein [Betaproteobacteria bacterium]|nr:MAG: DUF2157 domain-containing protein [Betaproteobacteria bacterium]
MDLRLGLYELAAEHRLDAKACEKLERLAGLHDEPAALSRWLPRGIAVLAAALGGLGIVFWIAANWDTLGRFGRFALLQAVVLVMCAGALWRPAARAPLGLLALLAIGGLFAYFGQTYQTGADAWQLFALWAALALPLCIGARSDVLWAPWALVVMSAVALWVQAHTGHRWRVEPDDLRAHAIGWCAALALAAALSPALQRFTGAGVWALRTAITLAVVMITATALGGLFASHVAAHYWLGLVVLAAAAVWLALPRSFEVYGLSAVALGINTLIVAGIARALFDRHHNGDPIGELLLLGLIAAGLLAATVSGVLRLARHQAAQAEVAQ